MNVFRLNRVKLQKFQSVHSQLVESGSVRLIAFERKYGLGGPIPEGLTNYLDVISLIESFVCILIKIQSSRHNITVILESAHRLRHFVLFLSRFSC